MWKIEFIQKMKLKYLVIYRQMSKTQPLLHFTFFCGKGWYQGRDLSSSVHGLWGPFRVILNSRLLEPTCTESTCLVSHTVGILHATHSLQIWEEFPCPTLNYLLKQLKMYHSYSCPIKLTLLQENACNAGLGSALSRHKKHKLVVGYSIVVRALALRESDLDGSLAPHGLRSLTGLALQDPVHCQSDPAGLALNHQPNGQVQLRMVP